MFLKNKLYTRKRFIGVLIDEIWKQWSLGAFTPNLKGGFNEINPKEKYVYIIDVFFIIHVSNRLLPEPRVSNPETVPLEGQGCSNIRFSAVLFCKQK